MGGGIGEEEMKILTEQKLKELLMRAYHAGYMQSLADDDSGHFCTYEQFSTMDRVSFFEMKQIRAEASTQCDRLMQGV